jgi:hypothetical protein
MFCEQCNLYDDSLPYLMQRRIHVQELIEDRPSSETEYSDSLDTELKIIESVWTTGKTRLIEGSQVPTSQRPPPPARPGFPATYFEEEDM